MDVIVTGRPSREAILRLVGVDDVKMSERITHSREDKLIEDGILAGYDFLDGPNGWMNGYFILESEVQFYLSGFENTLEIPIRPMPNEYALVFERMTAPGVYSEVALADYAIAVENECTVIASLSRTAFQAPSNAAVNPRAYRISLLAGHAGPDDVPAGIRKAIILLASHYYVHREAAFADPRSGQVSREIEFGVKALCGRYQHHRDHS
jgi:hypothetical protein